MVASPIEDYASGNLHLAAEEDSRGTSSVVGVVVNGGIWLLDSIVWSQQSGIERGKRGSKATVSTHPKYSQARRYTTYVYIGIKWNKGIICGLNCRMPE